MTENVSDKNINKVSPPVLVMGGEAVNPAILRQQETAFLHHDLWRPFRVHPGRGKVLHKFFFTFVCVSPESPGVQWYDGAHRLSGRVECVNFFESCVRHIASHLQRFQIKIQIQNNCAQIYLVICTGKLRCADSTIGSSFPKSDLGDDDVDGDFGSFWWWRRDQLMKC